MWIRRTPLRNLLPTQVALAYTGRRWMGWARSRPRLAREARRLRPQRARLYSQHGGGLMNRQLMLFLATAVFASLLLSGAPAAAQSQGQGTFGVDTCEPAKTQCPSGAPNAFGVCVAFANVCSDALRTGNPQLLA